MLIGSIVYRLIAIENIYLMVYNMAHEIWLSEGLLAKNTPKSGYFIFCFYVNDFLEDVKLSTCAYVIYRSIDIFNSYLMMYNMIHKI